MLRNTRIRTRLALMALAPALMALILVAITFLLVPGIAVGGFSYNEILAGRDFQADTTSPSLYILEIHTEVLQAAVAAAAGQPFASQAATVSRLRTRYEADYTQWDQDNPLKNATAKADLERSHYFAQQYFSEYDQRLLPLLDQEATATALDRARYAQQAGALLTGPLTDLLDQHAAAIGSAAAEVGREVGAQQTSATSRVREQLLAIVGITLLLMAGAIALGITVLRSITDRVRRLNEVATIELPQVLVEVQRAAAAGEDIPVMSTSASASGESGDELAIATSAFNAVVSTAVEMAAEQSRLRRSTSQLFVNLGRRNHKLLSRTLTYITQLESDERDPATLQNLFRLDHLTTRMRRHAESLLVLAGSPPLRTWSRPVPVADVLRAALSEIETYDRVDIKELEPVEVRGASVSDLAHLLAELLENATAFSPPQTRVRVLGRTDDDGYTIVVVDEGIGMSAEELAAGNRLINQADQSGFLGDSRMLGLGVVGRLAARHGFQVNLTSSPVGGVVAWITLPAAALAPRRGGETEHPGTSSAGLSAPDVAELLGHAPASGNPVQPVAGDTPLRPASPSNGKPTGPALKPSGLPLRPLGPAAGAPGGAPAVPAQSGARPDTANVDRPSAASPAASTAAAAPTAATAATPPTAPPETAPPSQAPTDQPPPDRSGPTVTGPIALPPRAPQVLPVPTGALTLPPPPDGGPVTGPISFARPGARPAGAGGLTRRIRGAQLPDTGESAPSAAGDRPERSAQSVRGALQSFEAGRRTAAEVSLGNAAELRRTEPREVPPGAPVTGAPPLGGRPAATDLPRRSPDPDLAVRPASGSHLPRRVRGAQMPPTELPEAAPGPDRSADEVRAALSNFVAGRRAADHQD